MNISLLVMIATHIFVIAFYLRQAGLVVGPLCLSVFTVHPSVCPQHFWGAEFVLSVTPKVFIPFYSNFAL